MAYEQIDGKPQTVNDSTYVDLRTQYRISRNPDGTAQYVMMRRLSEDGTRNVGTVLTPDGTASIDKAFMRVAR